MAAPSPSTSVVVVSQRPGDWLKRCVESVLPAAGQVVLVDNGSVGASVSELGRLLGVEVVRLAENRGFAGGTNAGIARARGELVFLLNDDAVADSTWFAVAEEVLADPQVAAMGPKVLLERPYAEIRLDDQIWFAQGDARPLGRRLTSVLADGEEVLTTVAGAGIHDNEWFGEGANLQRWRWTAGEGSIFVPLSNPESEIVVEGEPVDVLRVCTLVNSAGIYLRPDGASGDYGLEAEDDGRFDVPAERFGLSGVAIAARAETFRRLGALAEPFFAYYEDVDWAWRMRLAGLRLLYDPRAVVRHRRSATSGGSDSARVRLLSERNRLLCLVRNAPAGVARRLVTKAFREQNRPGIRRGLAETLPWALATRWGRLRAGRSVPFAEVWGRWSGADLEWGPGEGAFR